MNAWLDAAVWLEARSAELYSPGWVIAYMLEDGQHLALAQEWPVPWLRWAADNLPPAKWVAIRPTSTLKTKVFGFKAQGVLKATSGRGYLGQPRAAVRPLPP